jgi:hypothetical protein
MGRNARALCERKFSYPRFVEEHRRLLETLFASAPIPAHSGSDGPAARRMFSSNPDEARAAFE